ncbi:LPS assembly protein LptD, partial [Cribrihabitans sp. XS_ASV171]
VLGLNWARFDPRGWEAYATLGQVYRHHADPGFSKTSGLGGTTSDLLVAGQVRMQRGLSLIARGLLNDQFNFSKAELRGTWSNERTDISGSYLWLGRDPAENRNLAVSEVWLDGSYEVTPNWTALANIRYDIEDSRAINAGLGAVYRNECVTFNISINRRYTSSTSVEPSTDFGFTIALNGFAVESGNKEYRRSCNNS